MPAASSGEYIFSSTRLMPECCSLTLGGIGRFSPDADCPHGLISEHDLWEVVAAYSCESRSNLPFEHLQTDSLVFVCTAFANAY